MMANKTYWYFQLPVNFFANPIIRKLRRLAGGDTYCLIYLEIILYTLRNEGYLLYEGIEDNIVSELANVLMEKEEDVAMTMVFLEENGLALRVSDDGLNYHLPEASEGIGKITDSALRMRKSRMLKREKEYLDVSNLDFKLSHCDTTVTPTSQVGDIERESKDTHTLNEEVYRGVRCNIKITLEEYHELCAIYYNPKKLIDRVSCIMANSSPKKDVVAFIHKIAIEDGWPRRKKEKVEASIVDRRTQDMQKIMHDLGVTMEEAEKIYEEQCDAVREEVLQKARSMGISIEEEQNE